MRSLPRVLLFLLIFSNCIFAQTFHVDRYNSPDSPADVFVNDLNADGRPDILTANYWGEYVRYFLSRSDGTFMPDGSGTLTISRYALQVNSADYNGDGKQDVAVLGDAMGDPPAYVYLFTGRGDGSFDGPITSELMFAPTSMGYMKANNSNRMNLVFTLADPYIKIAYNTGDRHFVEGPTIPSPGYRVWGVSSADFNRDGLWDIAAMVDAAVDGQSLVYLFINNGNGTFTPKPIATVYANAGSTNAVDLNGDGAPDLLVPFQKTGSPGGVLVILNNGNATGWTYRTMTVPSDYHVGWKVAQRDLNGDGLHDIVLPVSNSLGGRDAVVVFPATSKTSWGPARYYYLNVADGPRAVAMGDFDADRRMDFALVSATSGTMEVFLNRTGCVPPVSSPAVNICSPQKDASVPSPATIKATARWDGATVTRMRAYVDDTARCESSSTTVLECKASLPSGIHRLTVNLWNSSGQVMKGSTTFSVQ